MIRAVIFPDRYVQGSGALSVLDEELARLGRRAMAICDPFVFEHLLETEIRCGRASGWRLPSKPCEYFDVMQHSTGAGPETSIAAVALNVRC